VLIPFNLEYPLEPNGTPARGELSEFSSDVLLNCSQLFYHGSVPL
jgi:hypothetical protein